MNSSINSKSNQSSTIKENPSGKAVIVCDVTKCTACHLCEDICSITKYNQIYPFLARIKAEKNVIEFPIAITCRQCKNAPCITICPTEALTMAEVLICDAEKCVLCGWCIEACPFGALNTDLDLKIVVACDLCPDKRIDNLAPCVAFCPREALIEQTWEEIQEKGEKYLKDHLLIIEE